WRDRSLAPPCLERGGARESLTNSLDRPPARATGQGEALVQAHGLAVHGVVPGGMDGGASAVDDHRADRDVHAPVLDVGEGPAQLVLLGPGQVRLDVPEEG